MLRIIIVFMLLGLAASVFPTDTVLAQPPDSLYGMPADTFFKLEKVRSPIADGHIDQELLSAAVFHATNQRRAAEGLDRLRHDYRLDEAALIHARNMARGQYLSHVNPDDPALRTPLDRVRAAGIAPRYVAENVATHFGIQYDAGTRVFIVQENPRPLFSETPDGAPIPSHTYRSFAQTLLDQWMDSPAHRQNILAPEAGYLGAGCVKHQTQGMGMDKFYCVQVFAAGIN